MSVPDLECGFSRDLFVQWTANPRNSVILTCRPSPGSLSRYLIDNPKTSNIELMVRGLINRRRVGLSHVGVALFRCVDGSTWMGRSLRSFARRREKRN